VRIRQQFGKPIISFQAIAHRLVRMAEEVELGHASYPRPAAARFQESGLWCGPWRLARPRASASPRQKRSWRAAHQLHGAMGMTREYPLHHFTRRLRAWSFEWGTGRAVRSGDRSPGSQIRRGGAVAAADRHAGARIAMTSTTAPTGCRRARTGLRLRPPPGGLGRWLASGGKGGGRYVWRSDTREALSGPGGLGWRRPARYSE